MGRRRKLLDSWKTTRNNARVDEVEAVLLHFFAERFSRAEGTSHQLRINHPALQGGQHFVGGSLSIPISGGQSAKPIYLRRIVEAVEIVEAAGGAVEEDENEDTDSN